MGARSFAIATAALVAALGNVVISDVAAEVTEAAAPPSTSVHCVIDSGAANINALTQSAPGNSGSLGEELGTFVSGSAIYGSG